MLVVERQHTVGEVKVHYIPGCLAFRELPLVVETMEKVNSNIDVCVFDGNGILHPRQAGLATRINICQSCRNWYVALFPCKPQTQIYC